MAGKIKQTGSLPDPVATYDSRDWAFMITEFAADFEWWKENSPTINGNIEWKTKGWIQNMAEHRYFKDMPRVHQN